MKSLLLTLFALACIAWAIYFVTHLDTLCESWWFAAEDLCIRHNR